MGKIVEIRQEEKEWVRCCPACNEILKKKNPSEPWKCPHCGWEAITWGEE